MTWLGAADALDALTERREQAEARRQAERLEAVRKRTEEINGPPPPDEPWQVIAEAHLMDMTETHPRNRNYRTYYRANCCCGWQARDSHSTEQMAVSSWKGHVRHVLGYAR